MLVSCTGLVLGLVSFYSRTRGEWSQYAQGEEGREDKLGSKSDFTRVYIHFGCTT